MPLYGKMNKLHEIAGTLLVKKIIRKYFSENSGATAIEYGLIIAGLSIAILATVLLLGDTLDANFVLIMTYI